MDGRKVPEENEEVKEESKKPKESKKAENKADSPAKAFAERTLEVVQAEYDKVCDKKRALAAELHNLKTGGN